MFPFLIFHGEPKKKDKPPPLVAVNPSRVIAIMACDAPNVYTLLIGHDRDDSIELYIQHEGDFASLLHRFAHGPISPTTSKESDDGNGC